ncbi:MAG: hypothetical protein QM694_01450 [Aestuariivirga sp.]
MAKGCFCDFNLFLIGSTGSGRSIVTPCYWLAKFLTPLFYVTRGHEIFVSYVLALQLTFADRRSKGVLGDSAIWEKVADRRIQRERQIFLIRHRLKQPAPLQKFREYLPDRFRPGLRSCRFHVLVYSGEKVREKADVDLLAAPGGRTPARTLRSIFFHGIQK